MICDNSKDHGIYVGNTRVWISNKAPAQRDIPAPNGGTTKPGKYATVATAAMSSATAWGQEAASRWVTHEAPRIEHVLCSSIVVEPGCEKRQCVITVAMKHASRPVQRLTVLDRARRHSSGSESFTILGY